MGENLDLIKDYDGVLAEWSKYTIVTLLPHADEPERLQALNKKPEECLQSDFHWVYKGNIYFVSIVSYYHPYTFAFSGALLDVTRVENSKAIKRGVINVRTDEHPIYTHTVEAILDKIVNWMENNPQKLARIYKMPRDPQSWSRAATIIDDIDKYQMI